MSALGYGPFGNSVLSSTSWSRRVLYDLIPVVYREADLEADGLLEAFITAIRPSFDEIKDDIRKWDSLRNPLQARTAYTETALLRLGKQVVEKGDIEQRGLDGSVNSAREFKAKTARFTDGDLGKSIEISGSSIRTNNRSVVITSVLDLGTVLTDPVLEVDAGNLRWDLRGKSPTSDGLVRIEVRGGDTYSIKPGWSLSDGSASLPIRGRRHFHTIESDKKHLTEKEGVDAEIDSLGRIYAPSGSFTTSDLGKKISLHGSLTEDNNAWNEILWVGGPSLVSTSYLEVQGSGSRASLTVAGAQPVVYTAVPDGVAGNSVSVEHIQAGLNTPLSIVVVGSVVTVNLATDGGGAITSTGDDVAAAIEASTPASALVTVATVGAAGTTGAVALTSLSGGVDYGTVRYFLRPGVRGVYVRHRDPGSINQPLTISVSADNKIDVVLETDGVGALVTTGAQLVAALQASTAANALVGVVTYETGNGLAQPSNGFEPVLGLGLTPDSGPMEWALLPFPILILNGNFVPNGLVEQEGLDGVLTSGATPILSADSASFSSRDLGKIVVSYGDTHPANNKTFVVTNVPSSNSVELRSLYGSDTIATSGLHWELRTPSTLEGAILTKAFAPSMLNFLAEDFGLELDPVESEDRQRTYVSSCNLWFDAKGPVEGYDAIGRVTGVDVTAKTMYRVAMWVYEILPSSAKYYVLDQEEGKSGSSTFIITDNGSYYLFEAPDAIFKARDRGRSILFRNCAPIVTDGAIYEIEEVVDEHTVKLTPNSTALPGPGGAFTGGNWAVVRLYSDYPPKRPLYDEINSDIMATYVAANIPGKQFSPDMFCWDEDFAAYVLGTVTAVTAVGPNRYMVTINGQADVVAAVGNWSLIYDDGTEIFLETVPVDIGGGLFTTELQTQTAPSTGSVRLQYNCPVVLTCDYCCSNRAYLVIEYDQSAFDSVEESEQVEARILRRLPQVTPQHVDPVYDVRKRLTASIKLSSTVEV